jgi:hypothetical protein
MREEKGEGGKALEFGNDTLRAERQMIGGKKHRRSIEEA